MPQDSALADVTRTFGADAAREVKRSLRRHGSRYCDLTTGQLHSVGRFAWYEAAGEGFRTRRWGLTTDGVFSLRDGADGLAQMFALHAPLVEREPLVKAVAHFLAEDEWVGGERALTTQTAAAPMVRDGVLSLDLVQGNDHEGRKRRVLVALATGVVSVGAPVSWHVIERPVMSLDGTDDATEHIVTQDPDRTHDDGSMTDDED